MKSSNPTARIPSITARPTPAEKERFAQVAASSGISESALALIAIRALLESNGHLASATASESGREPATDRITIRLRPGDGRAINQRAAQRGMQAPTYLAALVRAHIAASPPLTVDELAILCDEATFSQVFIEHGALSWPGDIDLAPDAMYQRIRSSGTSLLAAKGRRVACL